LANGTDTQVRNEYNNNATSGISGNISTNGSTVDTAIPGLTYRPNAGATPIDEDGKTVGYDGKGLISGTPTKAGIYHVTAYAKDYNRTERASGLTQSWNYDTQEGRGELTFVIAPKVTVKNISTYDSTVPVEISNGATYAEITTPDGSKTILKTNKEGKWVVQEGTTNTAVSAGDVVGTVGTEFSLSVKPEATATAGVSKISAYAKTEDVTANLMRTKVELNSVNGTKYIAVLNPKSGRYELADSDATVRTELNDGKGNYTITKREVSVRAQTDGSMKFDLYEYKRTYNNANKVTAVNDVTLTETAYSKDDTANTTAGNGMYITVKYDKNSDEWTASDKSTVTANKTGDDTWKITTSTGYTGTVKGVMAENTSTSTIINSKPTATSNSYESTLNTTVNLIDRPAADTAVVTSANVSVRDTEDNKLATSTAEPAFKESHKTKVTSITVTDPDGNTVFAETTSGDAANYPTATELKLTKVGKYSVTINVIDSNTNLVDGTNVGDTTAGTDHGVNTSTATTTYTITVKAGIEGTPETTSDIQGAVQKGTPSFNFDDAEKTKISSTTNGTKVYSLESTDATDNTGATVGTYAINADTGEVTFTPNPTFVGTPNPAKVTLTLTVDGVDPLTSKADYTPTVIGVKPEGTKVSSTDIQGQVQTGKPTFTPGSAEVNGARKTVPLKADSYKLLDSTGTEVADGATTPAYAAADNGNVKAGDEIGTFGIDKSTGLVTFTPTNKAYVGAVKAVQVVVSDNNGTQPENDKRGEYTPNILGVTPTASEASTTGIQGAVQKSEVVLNAKDENVNTLNFSKGSEIVNGTEKSVDLNEATLTLVGADGEGKVSVAGQGTYSIVKEDGKSYVQFTPVATYTGNVTPVTVKIADANGTEVTTTYTPKIVGVKPSAESSKTTGIQGETQTSAIKFDAADTDDTTVNFAKGTAIINSEFKSVELDKTSVKLVGAENGTVNGDGSVTVANQGTYKLVKDETGAIAVTFTPLATFTGEAHAVTVSIADANGTEATTTYTPTVVSVAPTAKESATVGKQGQAQTSQIVFDTPDTDATTLNFAKGETSEVLGEDGQPKSVALDKSTLTLLDANGNAVTTVKVDGEGTYTLDKTTNAITFQPTEEFTGKAKPVSVQIADINGTTVTTTYTPTVVAEDGTVIVEYKDEEGNVISPSTTPVNNEKVTTPFTTEPKEIPGYTLVKVATTNGTVDEATKKVSGKVTNDTTTVTYTYRKNVQTATISYYDVTTGAEVAIDSAKVPAASVETVEGVYNGAIDFTNREKAIAALEKAGYTLVEDSFAAARTADKLFDNDTAVNQNFKVTVKQRVEPVTPNDEKPVPGQPVDPEDPNSPVWPSTAENLELTKTVTRTIKYRYNDENGEEVTADEVQTVTFTRSASVNLVTGNVEYTDWSAAQTLEEVLSPEVANYTYDKESVPSLEVTNESTDSTVYVIYKPVAPTSTPATSTDIQGKVQTGTPTYKHADGTELKPTTDNPAKFVGTEETTIPATKDGKTVGTYTIAPTGTVTFTPNKDFVGTPDPAKVVVTDPTNGTTVESSYTPTVTPVTPTGVNTGSAGPKNTPQSGTPTFVPGHKDVPMDNTVPATFEDGTTSKTVPNEGTYTVDATGKVTFTPNKDFVGTATGVVVVRKDTNGTVAKAKYTPTVYEVKSDTQVATVTYKDTNGTILGEVDILQGDSGSEMNYSTAERINALKKLGYELVSDEFTKADGSKQSFDNDTNAIQKFVVTVQPRLVPVIPSDEKPVPGQPVDPEDPNSPVWPESVKELTTSEEVTRTITYVDGDGKEVTTSVTSSVKFTRDAKVNLVTGEVTYGEWKAATTDVLSGNKLPLVKGYIAVSGDIEASTKDQTVKAEDKDIVQKVVYKKLGALIPNVPGQTNPPRIDYPNDPNGDPTKPGVPTEDIVIPYVPGYIPRDKDGNPLKPVDPEDPTKGYVPPTLPTDPSQDTPINYTKITTSYVTVDPNGKEVPIPEYPTVEGNQPKKDIPGYEFVKTTTDKDGNVTHVYRKVVKTTTSFVDESGNPVSPNEEGNQPKKAIPGYEFVKTTTDKDGNVTHVYRKVVKTTTSFVDESGKPVSPNEEGSQPKKAIPGYEFVKTTTDKDGNVTHIYRKVVKTTTSFVDESGKPVSPNEEGSQPKKDIPGYEFVKTTTDKDGNVTHVYRKVVKTTTSFVDESGKPVSPNEEGSQPKKDIPGYEFVKTTTDKDGNVTHVYRKVTPPTPQPTPAQPVQPTAVKEAEGKRELPNTGTEDHSSLAALGLLGVLSGFGLVARKKKED